MQSSINFIFKAILFVFGLIQSVMALAETKTVTLKVSSMSCSVCPITVKKSLEKVSGVKQVDVSLQNKQAVVVYDDTQTTTGVLTQATANAGYPSSVK